MPRTACCTRTPACPLSSATFPLAGGHPQVQRAEFLTTNGKQGLHSSPRHPQGRPISSSDYMTKDKPGGLGGWQKGNAEV